MSRAPPPVGKCIYCGSTLEPLGREHVIPFALNGATTLLRASCQPCAKITGALEGYCLGKLLGPFRNAANFRTRKKAKRQKELSVKVQFDDGREGAIDLTPEEYPQSLHLPVFPIARALRGLPPDRTGDTTDGGGFWHWWDRDKLEALRINYGIASVELGLMTPSEFARMIAKIAHCAAVNDFGLEGFQPLAVDMILGRQDTMNYLVGGDGHHFDPPATDIHTVSYRTHDETGMLVVLVRLFAMLGAPTYHVLVGMKPGGRIAKVF